jgi:hypothetical protein
MVTRIVSGRNNFELATMVKVARALGCEFRMHLQRPEGKRIGSASGTPTQRKTWANPTDTQRVKSTARAGA